MELKVRRWQHLLHPLFKPPVYFGPGAIAKEPMAFTYFQNGAK
jgi:hypothetical protein